MGIGYVSQKEILKKRYRKLNFDRRYLIVGLIALILSVFIDIKRFLFIAVFIVANCLLLSLDRYLSMPVDLEFSTFSAVLTTAAYGLKWGIFVAIATKFAAMLYNANIRIDHVFMIIGYCVAAWMASFFPGMNIVTLGMISTFMTNTWIFFVSKYITNLSPFEIFMYGSSNIIFNFVLFMGFGEVLLSIMRL